MNSFDKLYRNCLQNDVIDIRNMKLCVLFHILSELNET